MNPVDQRDYLALLSQCLEIEEDGMLLDFRRTLNAELRARGYMTDQDSVVDGIIVAGAYTIGLLCGLACAVVWAVS